MLRIGICDDDIKIVNKIKNYIEDYTEGSLIDTFKSGEELLQEKRDFHVLFLDIDMSGINGIEAAKEIRSYDKKVNIIYITSYTDYVNLAFQVHAFGYLTKPVKKEDIYKQLDEVIAYTKKDVEEELIEFITVDGIVRIAPKEIYYFEYMDRRVKMNTKRGIYILKDKITSIAKTMSRYDFLVPHKSFTVNLFHVKSIKGYDIFMMDGSVVPLSQKKSCEFREELNKYLENHIMNL